MRKPSKKSKLATLDGTINLRPGNYLWLHDEIYRIEEYEEISHLIPVMSVTTGERLERSIAEIFKPHDKKGNIVTAPTLEQLRLLVANNQPSSSQVVSEAGLRESLVKKAGEMNEVVETVEKQLELARNRAFVQGNSSTFSEIDQLRNICAARGIGLSTYYKYRKLYRIFGGNRDEIANSLKRKKYSNSDKAQTHLLDTIIMRFYTDSKFSPRLLRPLTVYKILEELLKRTGNRWINPDKCKLAIPQDLIEELLDHRVPIESILENPEKAALLTSVKLPSRGRFYNYLHWYKAHPETSKGVIIARHGPEFWDNNFLVYDTFAHQAAFPLQYVFVDHWLTDVFIVDEETRSKVTRLWLTVLIDAYSRSILGFALNYEAPSIESIQSALLHAIWPKTSHLKYGLNKQWIAYGIPQILSMDNAWAHHSISLENLARSISQGGKYNTIVLMFRPPYKGRYGALIERLFGNLSNEFKQTLPGAIQSSHPKDVQNAAKKARLLYQDVDRLIHRLVLEYQHSPHRELNNMTPHQKWLEATQFAPIIVPPLTEGVERLFWRLSPDTRLITEKGVSVFGLHYSSNSINTLERMGKNGQPIEYGIKYIPEDISTIALFREGAWVGDLRAKELKQADGSYRSLSLWEKEIAKELATANEKSTRNWLEHINELEELSKVRQSEKSKRTQIAKKLLSDTKKPKLEFAHLQVNNKRRKLAG